VEGILNMEEDDESEIMDKNPVCSESGCSRNKEPVKSSFAEDTNKNEKIKPLILNFKTRYKL